MEYVVIVGYFAVLLSIGAAASRRAGDDHSSCGRHERSLQRVKM
jgi:hypothetical protein